jgi:hypothetical protein
MPGDPKECRAHALRCKEHAETSLTPDARRQFFELAEMWRTLAANLEADQDIIDAMEK